MSKIEEIKKENLLLKERVKYLTLCLQYSKEASDVAFDYSMQKDIVLKDTIGEYSKLSYAKKIEKYFEIRAKEALEWRNEYFIHLTNMRTLKIHQD